MSSEEKKNVLPNFQKNPENEKKLSDNIFAELYGELDFGHEQNNSQTHVKKDKIYYLKLTSSILTILNIVAFVFILIGFSFVKIQNNENLYNTSYIDPFCSLILPSEVENTSDSCSSVAALVKDYEKKISELEKAITDKLSAIISDLYVAENFINSNEITFLINSKNNRLRVLDILNDFDNLKNDFSGGDKGMIYCYEIRISSDNILDVTCDVNSSSWEAGIIGFSGDRTSTIEGTSISVAASFLNFIEKNPKYNFQVIEKQKSFSSEPVVGEGSYVKKTNIKFKVKYNNLKSSLSL